MAAMTLTEFLLARLTEDEAEAHRVHALRRDVDFEPHTFYYPTRVLAECEAKRRIVEGLQPFGWLDDINAPEILGLLAAVYADHPDYQQEWGRVPH